MGRRRRKGSRGTEINDLSAPVLTDAACDLFVTLLNLCGLFPDGDASKRNHRLHLMASVTNLATEMAKVNDSISWNDEAIPINEASSSRIRRFEDAITQIRRRALTFLAGLNEERVEILHICHSLDLHLQEYSYICWRLFARSILEIFHVQSALEEETVENFGVLDDMYSLKGRHNVNAWFQDLTRCLSREPLIEQIYFRGELNLLRQLVLQGDHPTSIADGVSIPSKTLRNTHLNPKSLPKFTFALADLDVIQAKSIESSVATFFQTHNTEGEAHVTTLLVIGPEGSGKTHTCNLFDTETHDILQGSVGETEDVFLSLGRAVKHHNGNVLVIVDDVDHIFGSKRSEQTHRELRCQSATLSLLDSLRRGVSSPSNVMVVFTTSNDELGVELSRFDKMWNIRLPDERDRMALITDLLQNFTINSDGDKFRSLLASFVESTVGRSYSELIQYCRQSMESVAAAESDNLSEGLALSLLGSLKQRLQAITPESLRAGVCDDYVDMRVLGAQELLCAVKGTNGAYNLPMKGDSAAKAWHALQTSIYIPLCRSKELHALMGEDMTEKRKSVVGAILLVGEPGCGKSEIALHCAKNVAQQLPSMKLIDVSCTSLIHKEVGRSERAVHYLFDAARKAAPCLVLLDGIENIAAVRGNDMTSEGTMDRVLSTLLIELDGVDDGLTGPYGGIAVIGITHNPEWIDPALKRPGRLDRAIRLARDWD